LIPDLQVESSARRGQARRSTNAIESLRRDLKAQVSRARWSRAFKYREHLLGNELVNEQIERANTRYPLGPQELVWP
jgi:hypothetical protein